jgi:hypothetical protein
MTGTSRVAGPLRRLPPVLWVLAVAVVAAGLVSALGGFAPASDRGRSVAPGDQILTQRWRLHIDDAALVDDSPPNADPDPAIRVRVRTEFTGTKTLCCLSERMLGVRFGGQVVTRTRTADEDVRSTLGYDPGVLVARVLEFPLESDALPDPLPDRVEVIVRDERPSRSLILDDWRVTHAVAGVDLPCADDRARR